MILPLVSLQFVLATIVSIHHGTNGDVTSSLQNGASSSSSSSSSSSGNAESLLRVRRQGENFVRFARAPSSFVRIGKMDPIAIGADHSGISAVVRSDRIPMNRFIRIGRQEYSGNEGTDDDVDEGSIAKEWLYSKMKRPSSFVRIGKSMSDDGFSESSYDKRGPGFVRIGKDWVNKRPSGFVRIGKDFGGEGSDDNDKDVFQNKRGPGFVRIGKSPGGDQDSTENDADKRGNFVRIGKSGSSLFNPDMEEDNFDEENDQEEKRAPGFVRIGKSGDDIMDKRGPGFVRIGKALDDEMSKRGPGFVRIGKSINDNLLHKRAPGFVRIGKAFDDEMSKRAPGFVRIGKAMEDNLMHKRGPGFVRIGKDLDEEMSKKSQGFVRIGKALDEAMSKRGPGFVRIGKSDDDEDDDDALLHKRGPGFVRIGKSNFYDDNVDDDFDSDIFMSHRPERSVFADGFDRSIFEKDLVKKSQGFVRIGKSDIFDSANLDKRPSGFVRIGKDLLHSDDAQEREMLKKNSGFVRIGKQTNSNINPDSLLSHSAAISSERMDDAGGSDFKRPRPIRVSRRGSAFVRIGKIPSAAFVPLNKDIGRMLQTRLGKKAGYRRRSRNGQSSFVRIG